MIGQVFTDWEAICVNDGSTDGSGGILDEYAKSDSRLRIYHIPNGGVGAARNFGLSKVSGRYVTFLDADDVIDSQRLKLLATLIDQYRQVDWIAERGYTRLADYNHLKQYSAVPSSEISGKSLQLWGWNRVRTNALLWLNTYRFECIKEIRFPDGVKYAEDDIYELRCLPKIHSCISVQDLGYVYRDDRPGAASRLIEVSNSSKIGKLLQELGDDAVQGFKSSGNANMFSKVFTRIVIKDFLRVYQRIPLAAHQVQEEVLRVSREIVNKPYFNYLSARQWAIGYYVYTHTGSVWLIKVTDYIYHLVLRLLGMVRKFK